MKQIFTHEDDQPITFFLVSGPTNVTKKRGLDRDRVKSLARDIKECSGKIVTDMDAAEVWVVADDALPKYKRYCANNPDHRAVGEDFVDSCIAQGKYEEELPIEKVSMRGRYPGIPNLFTEEDEMLLCNWIAAKIPVKDSGGRLGVVIWRMLYEATAEFPHGMWADAKRHPISSWRQHYKMNQGRLDLIVNELVRQKGLNPQSRTAYTADRRRNTDTFAVKVRRIQTGEDEEDEVEAEIRISEDEDLSEDLDYSSTRARSAKRPRTANPRRRGSMSQEAGPSGVQRSPSASPPMHRVAARKPAAVTSTPRRPTLHRLRAQAPEPSASLDNSQRTLVNPSPAKTNPARRASKRTIDGTIKAASPSFEEEEDVLPANSVIKKWRVKARQSNDDQQDLAAYVGARPPSATHGHTLATHESGSEEEEEEEGSAYEYPDDSGSAFEVESDNPFAVPDSYGSE